MHEIFQKIALNSHKNYVINKIMYKIFLKIE